MKDHDLYALTEPSKLWKEELRPRGINEEEEQVLPDLYFFTKLKKKTRRASDQENSRFEV